ncbi:MAG: hypothetical protein C0501_31455 [Isosphaera sp.]|nr:hypothetical protein [Isosphaera sp.]
MTADTPRSRLLTRAALAAALALAGCKSKDGGGGGLFGSTPPRERDPLVYGPNRIPPQNVPVPDRGAVGAKGKGDPLTTPVGKADKSGAGYSDDPERFKGVYTPRIGTTPSGLAGNYKDEQLGIDDRADRVPLRKVGDGVRPAGNVEAAGEGLEALYAELERFGVKRAEQKLERADDGGYVFRAAVPFKGARKEFSGVGATAAAAVRQVLDQVVADRE